MVSAKFGIWSLGVTSTVIVLMFAVTLCRVWKGERFKLFMWQCALTILANLGYLTSAIGIALGFKY